MKKISTLLYAISLLGVVVFAGPASAQGYPNKTVKVLVGYTPGSSTDIVGRLMAQALTEAWKQSVVVENRGGAAGNLAADAVAKAAPDGYTVLFAQNGLAISTAANPKLPFNGETDLIPVVAVAATPHILVVPMTSPAKSVQDLIAMAKKSKAQLNFGSGDGRNRWGPSALPGWRACSDRHNLGPVRFLFRRYAGRITAGTGGPSASAWRYRKEPLSCCTGCTNSGRAGASGV